MLEQGRKLSYTYSRTTRHAANAGLTERLASLAGPGFERAHLTSGGSEAVEMALKFLRAHAVTTGQDQRRHVISLMPRYNGATAQTLGLNGDIGVPALWGPLTVLSEKIPAPLRQRPASSCRTPTTRTRSPAQLARPSSTRSSSATSSRMPHGSARVCARDWTGSRASRR